MSIYVFLMWTFFIGWIFYWIGYARREAQVRNLRRENYNLRRWVEAQTEAVISNDLDFEIERIRNAR